MNRTIELLAPGGDIDSIKAAIAAGADAVYCGLGKFNARNSATNIGIEDLNGILKLAHENHCQVFLTMNIIIVESEIPALIGLLNKLTNTSLDGIIIQDIGVLDLVSRYFKRLKIHASTQLTTHNEGQIQFLSKLAVTRVNLSRELSLSEIKVLSPVAHTNHMLVEVFVHGSSCICFSGLCYISSVQGGNSGNRGRCSQPCRDQYVTTPEGNDFPLNLKDNSAFTDLKELSEVGVDSIKIEGRIKKFHYVFTIVAAWRSQLALFYAKKPLRTSKNILYQVFNRDFSNGYLKDEISGEMFIDNPRDHSAIYLAEKEGKNTADAIDRAKGIVYDDRTEMIANVENILSRYSTAKAPLKISLSGSGGKPLKVSVQTLNRQFDVLSSINLVANATQVLNYETVFLRLKALNDTEYFIESINLADLPTDVFLPYKELTAIKKKLLFILNDSKEFIEPIDVPLLKKHHFGNLQPSLSILISACEDIPLCHETAADVYFQLPNCFKNGSAEYVELFIQNKDIIPWFPSVLIGENYDAAVELLHALKPRRIVTNNTGIAYEAYKEGITWIAGPFLNTVNSFALACLKETFNCSGAFISNEINKIQIQAIKRPEAFDLYYSIYHPIVLMTSRQCLFQQVTGCEKHTVVNTCIFNCSKSAKITNLKEETFVLEKSKGNYHRIFHPEHFLNLDIVHDLPNFFSGYFIDLTNLPYEAQTAVCKGNIIRFFENVLQNKPESKSFISSLLQPATNGQYKKGI